VSSNVASNGSNNVTPSSIGTAYNASGTTGTITITPAPLTIIGATTSRVFNNTTQTNVFTTSGLLGSDSVTSVLGSGFGLRRGVYTDTLSNAQGSGLSNYTIQYVNGAITITPAPIYAIVTPASGVVAGVSNNLPNTTTLVGILPGTSVTGSTILTIPTGSGSQTITNNGTTLSGPDVSDYELVSSNLASDGNNNVTPDLVASGNGGGTIYLRPASSTINAGTVTNVANAVPVQVPVVIPVVVNSVSVNTSSPSLSLNSISFVSFGSPAVGNIVFKVTLANGDPLPDWVKVDPVTNTLTVADVPEAKNTKLTINVQKLVNGKLKKEALLTLEE
jgi:hypothetical protein